MTSRAAAGYLTLAAIAVTLIWLLFVGLPRWYAGSPVAPGDPAPNPPATATRKITVKLFYVAEDGMRLVTEDREVAYGEAVAEQARRILEAQLQPPAPRRVSAIPAGTRLKSVYVTERGEAFVDLSREASEAHPGGSLNEIFTVYTIVNTLTTNLPAISAVQILIDGKEADTLAGHVDLRRPLQKDLRWTEQLAVGTRQ